MAAIAGIRLITYGGRYTVEATIVSVRIIVQIVDYAVNRGGFVKIT